MSTSAPSTISLPEHERSTATGSASGVTGLRVRGTEVEHLLDPRMMWWSIGSGPSCHIRIDGDPHVSGDHAVIVNRPDGLVILDRGSKNGLVVNGGRVQRSYLHDGALVRVGMTTLVAFGPTSRHLLVAYERLAGPDVAQLRVAIRSAARGGQPAVVRGEAGAGKRCVAEALHQESTRAVGPLVEVSCAVLPPAEVGEALVFGARRAAGGTLLWTAVDRLDGRAALAAASLLRGLEGSGPDAPRVIATVSAELPHALLGSFPVTLGVPALRDRVRDVRALAQMFAAEAGGGIPVSLAAVEIAALAGLDWPGNVAELRARVHRAVVDCLARRAAPILFDSEDALHAALERAMGRAERRTGSKREAALALGLSWSTYKRWSRRLGR